MEARCRVCVCVRASAYTKSVAALSAVAFTLAVGLSPSEVSGVRAVGLVSFVARGVAALPVVMVDGDGWW